MRDGSPETGDLEHELSTVAAKKCLVVGGLVVLPNVVEDRCVDVAMVMAVVRVPLPGQRVEVHDLRLLGTVAAALPREHRAGVAGLSRRSPSLGEPAVAVHQQPAGDLRQPEVEVGVDVELVPEHVPAVGLPIESSSRHARVMPGSVSRAHLQHMGGVETQQQLHAGLAGQFDVTDVP